MWSGLVGRTGGWLIRRVLNKITEIAYRAVNATVRASYQLIAFNKYARA